MTEVTIDQAMQMALALQQGGRLTEAEAIYRQVLTQVPDHPDALHRLGVVARRLGRTDDAVHFIGRAIAVNPTAAEYYNDLGQALNALGRRDEAIATFGRVVELIPDSAEAYNNLGIALRGAGRLDEAIAACRRAIALRANHAVAHNTLGNALCDAGQIEDAVTNLTRAVGLAPGSAEAHNNLGVALRGAGRLDDALAAFDQAIALRPDYALAYGNLGNALNEVGRSGDALAVYHHALTLRPDHADTHSNVLLSLHYDPAHDARMILDEHRRWAERFATPLAAQIEFHPNDRTPERKLRIGFVSPDLCGHPVGRLLRPLFAERDRRHAEFLAYSDVRAVDGVTHELQGLADGWLSIVGMSDTQVADRIRHDRIDILVDLALHTASNRMLVFARKPAPVQVTMLGLPTTTGLDTIDYRLTDPYLDPPGATDDDYAERSVRLPHAFWCYQPDHASPPVAALPARRNEFVTFGCLNQFAKVTRPTLICWISLLQTVTASRLVLYSPAGSHRGPILTRFQEAGIAADRVEFVAKAPFREYLERYHHLDLCLDPFPFSGGTTTMDALWMGVPVITLAGQTAVGRGGVSILSNLGFTELIARTPEQYVEIALAWSEDLDRLASIRSGLRSHMQASHLMDSKQYAAEVEAALRGMWRRWCEP